MKKKSKPKAAENMGMKVGNKKGMTMGSKFPSSKGKKTGTPTLAGQMPKDYGLSVPGGMGGMAKFSSTKRKGVDQAGKEAKGAAGKAGKVTKASGFQGFANKKKKGG